MMFKKIFLIVLFFNLFLSVNAQYFSAGQDPASVNWKQINTPHFQIIFPESFGSKAHYVANILNYSYEKLSHSLENKPRKISVILHNQTVVSNGFVSPTPYRMELFSVPPQNNLAVPWLEHLCVHELRHAVQLDKLNQGLTKVLTYLFGQQATGGVAGLVPFWFYEGDAVLAETALLPSGRGRQSAYNKEIRSIALDSSLTFSFNKMLLGSYKHNTPNHYSLGYHLTSYLRKETGTYVWSDVMDHTAKNPYQLVSFNLGMKKHANLYSGEVYKQTISYYDSLWNQQDYERQREPFRKVNPSREVAYKSYRYPQYTEDGKIIAVKKSFSDLTEFVSIEGGEEETIHIPGIMTSEKFSCSNGIIAWGEREYDLRWDHRSYSVIKLYDIEKQKEIDLTQNTRLFSPELNEQANRIACVRVSENNEYSILILNRETGFLEKQLSPPANQFLQKPTWGEKEQFLYVIGLTQKGKTIYQVNLQTGKWQALIEPTYDDIQSISAGKNEIYFHADKGSKDNIFKFDLTGKTIYQLTYSLNGAYDVSYTEKNQHLLYTDYSSEGYNIYELNMGEYEPREYSPEKISEPVVTAIKKQEPSAILTKDIPDAKYSVSSYSKWKHLFRFHSWAPFYFDYESLTAYDASLEPGLLLLSQNDLSTATSSIGYSYDDNRHQVHTKFTYKGWYPVISISSNYGETPDIVQPGDRKIEPDPSNDFIDFSMDVSLPLTLNVNRYTTRIIPRIDYEYGRDLYYNIRDNYYLRGLKTLRYNLLFYSLQRRAHRDIMPEWGVWVNMDYLTSPFSENILGNRFSLMANTYFPGLFRDHGIKLNAGYQKQDTEMYYFSNYLQIPRGYETVYGEELLNFKADYVFPLFYPDWSVSSLLYVKRFKANLFVDYARNKFRAYDNNNQLRWYSENLLSYGAELTTDFHVARVMFPFSTGVRYAYQPISGDHNFELVFNVDLYSLYNKFRK
jgi:hypothetical protein